MLLINVQLTAKVIKAITRLFINSPEVLQLEWEISFTLWELGLESMTTTFRDHIGQHRIAQSLMFLAFSNVLQVYSMTISEVTKHSDFTENSNLQLETSRLHCIYLVFRAFMVIMNKSCIYKFVYRSDILETCSYFYQNTVKINKMKMEQNFLKKLLVCSYAFV